uniref:Uncharacterized protein n=1 Tax=viral metagenome TaxID=1070528 RepID=A0A6M3J5H9_9ZZZZ
MAKKKALDTLTPFQRWNQIRSDLSRAVKAQGKTLQKGEFNRLNQSLYHSTKDQPYSRIQGRIFEDVQTAVIVPTLFIIEPRDYFNLDPILSGGIEGFPDNVWFDVSQIAGEGIGFYINDYDRQFYEAHLQAFVNYLNKHRTSPYQIQFIFEKPVWNRQWKRWEAKLILLDEGGHPLEESIWDAYNQEMIGELPEAKPEPEAKPKPEPKPEPDIITKAKVVSIQKSDIRKDINLYAKRQKEILKEMVMAKELGDKDIMDMIKQEFKENNKLMRDAKIKLSSM